MNISDLKNTDFTEDTEPRDDEFMSLLGKAYRGEITCTMAIAKIEVIKPFSDFKTSPSEQLRRHFTSKAKQGMPLPIHVYAKDGNLIMSDDYNSFALYKELNLAELICIVVGETPKIEGVVYHGEPFKLPLPSLEVID